MPSRRTASPGALATSALGLALRVLIGAPRRQLNLRRWVDSREFTDLHDASVAWLEQHFQVIERGAPWLHRIGSDSWDVCQGGVSNPILRLAPGHSASAVCVRQVTAVYGFDGPLTARLISVGEALLAAGWELTRTAAGQAWTDLDGTANVAGAGSHRNRWIANGRALLRWRPTAALTYPAGGEGTPPWGRPPLSPSMRVSWSSRGQETGVRPNPDKTRGATRNFLPLEASDAGLPDLLREALDHHEHALRMAINLCYYSNPNARARPHRIPRYFLPTRHLAMRTDGRPGIPAELNDRADGP
jgi:hypothetical protein